LQLDARITHVFTAALATAWRHGRLEYLGEPLKYVVADVNRYSNGEISLGDAAAGELSITGTVSESDIGDWLKTLEEILPLTVERTAAGRFVIHSR